jgi:hypothetical protein
MGELRGTFATFTMIVGAMIMAARENARCKVLAVDAGAGWLRERLRR